jgi:hypothetical protein
MLPQVPMPPHAAPAAPPAPSAPTGRGGFNPRDLMALLGAVSALRGNPGFAQGLIQSDARARQQALDDEERRIRRQQFESLERNRKEDNERQLRAQRVQFIQSLPAFIGDEGIETAEEFERRFATASRMGQELGVDPGFMNTYRPQVSVFTQRRARKKLADLSRAYSAPQMAQLEEMQPNGHPVATFEFEGRRVGIAELRQLAGVGAMGPHGGAMALPKPPGADLPLDRQAANALAAGDMVTYNRLMKVIADMDAQRRDPSSPSESRLARKDAIDRARERLKVALRRRNAKAFGRVRSEMEKLGLDYEDERVQALQAIETENVTNASRRRLLDEYGIDYETGEQIEADINAMPVDDPVAVTGGVAVPTGGGRSRPAPEFDYVPGRGLVPRQR